MHRLTSRPQDRRDQTTGRTLERLLREIEENPNKQFVNLLRRLLPQKIIDVFIEKTSISSKKVLYQLTREERTLVIKTL